MEVISLRLWAASGQWLLHIRVRLYLFGMNRGYVYINAYPVYPQALTLYCTDHVVHPFVNWKYSQVLRSYSGTIRVLFTQITKASTSVSSTLACHRARRTSYYLIFFPVAFNSPPRVDVLARKKFHPSGDGAWLTL